jgi:hypothetical protein
MLCIAQNFLVANEARAQCTARDVLQNELRAGKTPSTATLRAPVRSALDAPVWKTIAIGTFANAHTLMGALDAAGCSVGNLAGEILARPAFALSAIRTNVDLVAISADQLGFQADTASLGEIYARARQLGFRLAPAEVAPQLRLQYFDQPIGEFLIIAMEPIKTWKGEPVTLTVANGGAGLVLIGQDGRASAQIPVRSRFLFARSPGGLPAERLDEAAARLSP